MSENTSPGSDPGTDPGSRDSSRKSWLANLAQRLLTAAVLAPLLLWLLYLGPWWGFQGIALIAAGIAGSELMTMTLPEAPGLRVWGVVATVAWMAVVLFIDDAHIVHATSLGIAAGGLLCGLFAPLPPERAGYRMAWIVAGPMYVGGFIATIASLHRLEHGGSWVVLSMMLAWLGDTGAYFAGRFFGRHKLYPSVSPSKTVEGSLGGLGGSLLGVLVAHFWLLPSLSLGGGLVLGLVAGTLGQSGDLIESLIKRSTGTKDSGAILPGHGGLLDRIDALMFTGATTWVYATWLWPG